MGLRANVAVIGAAVICAGVGCSFAAQAQDGAWWYGKDEHLFYDDNAVIDDGNYAYDIPSDSVYRPGLIVSAARSLLRGIFGGSRGRGGAQGAPALPRGATQLYRSATGTWLLFSRRDRRGDACSIVYSQGDSLLIFSGPSGRRPGAVTFMGPQIPGGTAPREVRITLSADGRPVSARAFIFPAPQLNTLIMPVRIQETLGSIGDNETVEIAIDGQTVYRIQTDGGHTARRALQTCLT